MVAVACKVPNGLLISGNGKQAQLRGSAQVPIQERVGGYAITENVDGDLWAAWLKANADSAVVENKIVFAEDNVAVLRARAWSRTSVRGFNNPAFKG
jgi:hypothetical protein